MSGRTQWERGTTPVLNLSRDAVRVTRAVTTEAGTTREFVLVESRGDISPVIRSIEKDKAFEKRPISGLPVWWRSAFCPGSGRGKNSRGRFAARGGGTGPRPPGNQTRLENHGPALRPLPGPEPGQRASSHLARSAETRGDVSSDFHPGAARRIATAWSFAHSPEPGESAAGPGMQILAKRDRPRANRTKRTATLRLQSPGYRALPYPQPPEIDTQAPRSRSLRFDVPEGTGSTSPATHRQDGRSAGLWSGTNLRRLDFLSINPLCE